MSEKFVETALGSLGKGFDVTSDFRLKYCKGKERLVLLNESQTRNLSIPGFGSIPGVSTDIKCDKGDRTRYQSDILGFNQMSELFNQKCSGPGKIPTGRFNKMFGFQSGSWATDAADTKYLGLDGYFIILFSIRIDRYPLVLSDEVRNAVPSTWDPSALARFIEKHGTHVLVGLNIGGQDSLTVRQDKSSKMEPSKLRQHLDSLGDQMFAGACSLYPHQCKAKEVNKQKSSPPVDVFDPAQSYLSGTSSITSKDGITVMCMKRGGDLTAKSHCEWILTVPSMPDAIHFSFLPITSLLNGVPGKGFLSHAINLYLRYKPPIAELQYFLDFQAHKSWAPVHNYLSLGPATNRTTRTPALQFKLMGPKLYVNSTKVTVEKRPITGMRLYLEGMKSNRLAVHLEHLTETPVLLQDKIDDFLKWRGSEELANSHYFEPINWKLFSHVCTAPVKYDPEWTRTRKDETFIVTGAQLHVKKHESKRVLHLRLLYSKVSGSYVVQSNWVWAATDQSQRTGILSGISASITGLVDKDKVTPKVVVDSGIYPNGPPVPVQAQKLLRVVDMSQVCRGPVDTPGYWLVTGAKLELERGKICLHVKFSLLNTIQ